MFSLTDGREHFYQWDTNRQVQVSDPTVNEVHFCNKTDDCSLVVEVVDGIANVPNILLQTDFPVRVYAYCGEGYTKVERVFKVHSRTKPSDYAYTETEVKTYEALEKRIDEIEMDGVSQEMIGEAVEKYLTENTIISGATDEQVAQINKNTEDIINLDREIDNLPTKEYVDNAVENVSVDLTGYATEKWVKNQGYLTKHQSLSGYATQNWVKNQGYLTSIPSAYVTESELNAKGYLTEHQSLTSYATKDYVASKIAEAELGGADGEVDLSAYATKEYVDEALSNVELTDYATKEFVEGAINNIPEPDLTDYATKNYVDASISDINIPEPDLTGYATEEWVEEQGYLTEHQSLSEYAKKTDIPSLNGYATEQWVEDKNYLTEHQSLEDYALKSDIPTNVSQLENDSGYLTTHQSLEGLATEKYVDDKVGAIPKPDFTGYATEDYVDTAIDNIDFPETDLTGYATENWVKTQGYLTSVPSEYVTELELSAKGYATNSSLSVYAKKTELPTVPTKVSELVNDKGYLTEHIDISGKSDKGHQHTLAQITDYVAPVIPTKVGELTNDKNYTTKTYVDTAIAGIDHYTKEETEQAIYNSKDAYYLDLTDAPTSYEDAPEDVAEVGRRFLNNENVCVYVKDASYVAYRPVSLAKVSEDTIGLIQSDVIMPNVRDNKPTDYSVYYIKENADYSGFTYAKQSTSHPITITTKEYVDELLSEFDVDMDIAFTDDGDGNITIVNIAEGTGDTIDLSNYYTKEEVDTEVAKNRVWVNSQKFATQTYVDNAIANIDIPETNGGKDWHWVGSATIQGTPHSIKVVGYWDNNVALKSTFDISNINNEAIDDTYGDKYCVPNPYGVITSGTTISKYLYIDFARAGKINLYNDAGAIVSNFTVAGYYYWG